MVDDVRVRKTNLAQNALLNTIKQCCVIIFPLISFKYVSGILGTTNYGKINFGLSVISYVALVAALGIAQYAIREGARVRDDKAVLNRTIDEIFTINLLSTAVALVGFAAMLLLWHRLRDYRLLLVVQCSTVVFTTLGTDWVNSIFEDYYILTLRYIIFHALAIVCMFLFVKKREDYVVYALITSLSSVVPNFLNIFYIRKNYGVTVRPVALAGARRHLAPIMILFASSVASLIYINSDVTILGVLRGDAEVGLYSVSAKIYSLVKQLINAFMYVAIPKISNELANNRREEAQGQLNMVLNVALSLIIPIGVGIFLLSENVVLFISSAEYLPACASLRILSAALLFSCLACFFINIVLLPLGMEKIILIATSVSAAVNAALNFVLIPSMGGSGAALTTVLAEFIMVGFGIFHARGHYRFRVGRALLTGAITGAAVAGIVAGTRALGLTGNAQLIASIAAAGVVYVGAMFMINREELKSIYHTIKK